MKKLAKKAKKVSNPNNMKALFKNIIDAPAATMAGAITLFLGAFIASDLEMPKIVLVTLMAVSAFLSIFSGPNTGSPSGRLPLVIIGLTCLFFLPSCVPSSYVVNTKPYGKQVITNPESVVMKPEHVIPVSGIRFQGGIEFETDHGTIGIRDDGVHTDLVVDATSGK